jgi:hypothetical protein
MECGHLHCCGMLSRNGGEVKCWGWEYNGPIPQVSDTPNENEAKFNKIWIGYNLNCGRLANGSETILCW